ADSEPPKADAHSHEQEAAKALLDNPQSEIRDPKSEEPLSIRNVSLGWAPYVLMSVLLLLTGIVRQMEGERARAGQFVFIGPIQTNYMIPIPGLHRQVTRDAALEEANEAGEVSAPKPEKAEFNFAWLTAPGTAVFFAALISMVMYRMNRGQI